MCNIKGGRPRLPLTDEERKEHRRKQQEAWRRRNGIMPREILTWEERYERNKRERAARLDKEYHSVWHKQPGEPFTPMEFAAGQNRYRAWVRARRERNCPLSQPVDFVCKLRREERKQQRAEWLKSLEQESPQGVTAKKPRKNRVHNDRQEYVEAPPPIIMPSVGRNQPCPCGSGRKFKKCCGS